MNRVITSLVTVLLVVFVTLMAVPFMQGLFVDWNIQNAISYLEDDFNYIVLGSGSQVPDNLVPSSDNTYDLGAAGNRWRDLFLGGTLNAKTGRAATYTVAASGAPAHVKAQADFVCDGTADNVEIQAAIDAVSSSGLVQLSKGVFHLSASIEIVTGQDNITLQGNKSVLKLASSPTQALTQNSGIGTTIKVADSSGFSVGQDVWIRSDTYYENNSDYRSVVAIPDSNTITINSNTSRDWQTSDNAKIVGICRYINVKDATEADYVKNTTIRGIIFDGNESTVSVKGSWHVPMLNLYCTEGTLVEDCWFRNSDTCAAFVSGGSSTITHNYFSAFKAKDAVNGYDAVHLASAGEKIVSENTFYDISAEHGIFFCQSVVGSKVNDNTFSCDANCTYTVYISNANDQNNIISGNTFTSGIWAIRDDGTHTLIENNTIKFPDTSSGIGIGVYGDKAHLVGNYVYKGNHCYRLQNSDYTSMFANRAEAGSIGLQMRDTTNCKVRANDLASCTTKINFAGTNTGYTIRDNDGWVTENTGLAENVTLDASGIGAIAHGCSATPTYANVVCQSANLNVRISSIDATNINIYVFDLDGAAVTVDTHDFYWEAKVR